MKKKYTKPVISTDIGKVGFPTVLAIGAVSAAVGAASVAVGRMVGSLSPMDKSTNILTSVSKIKTRGFA
ncbi:hypothetical protein IHE26_02020 [Plesiomonas shigelloides]|uniref:hypothetical protein n=1 Tax=Plesiomonas shigelloides TaxID=703 RepID=UPI001784541A|nr:hypothetical protein [Plesiomonas shigelloides]MDT1012015.1 hypothetical protein [Plesiomonas shigelloides]QOH80126.1 hypothetical protein IHE26_02020 [Plesiomonas shigelloides]